MYRRSPPTLLEELAARLGPLDFLEVDGLRWLHRKTWMTNRGVAVVRVDEGADPAVAATGTSAPLRR